MDCTTLHEVFATFGTVLSCKVVTDAKGLSKGYGYVQFDEEEAAQEAMRHLSGVEVAVGDSKRQVFIRPFVCKEERYSREIPHPDRTAFVKKVSPEVDKYEFSEVFESYGAITAIFLESCKGVGFVEFKTPDSAASAIEKLNGYQHGDNIWRVEWAKKASDRISDKNSKFEQERNGICERIQGANLYVKNLDYSTNDERLKELFSEFGEITSCKVMVDSCGQSRCFGFVAFTSVANATKAVNEMNGKMMGQKPLYVAVAQNKEERKAMLLLQARASQIQPQVLAPPICATQLYSGLLPHILPYWPLKYMLPCHLPWQMGQKMPQDQIFRQPLAERSNWDDTTAATPYTTARQLSRLQI